MKKTIFTLLILMAMLAVCSCGKKKKNNVPVSETDMIIDYDKAADAKKQLGLKEDYIKDYKGSPDHMVLSGDTVWISTIESRLKEGIDATNPEELQKEQNYTYANRLFYVSVKGGSAQEVSVPEHKNDIFILNIFPGNDNKVIIKTGENDKMLMVDPDGNIEETNVPSDADTVSVNSVGGLCYCKSSENNSELYIDSESSENIIVDGTVRNIIGDEKKGRIYLLVGRSSGTYVDIYDADRKEKVKSVKIGTASFYSNTGLLKAFGDYDFLLSVPNGVYGVYVEAENTVRLLDANELQLIGVSVEDALMPDDVTFMALLRDEGSKSNISVFCETGNAEGNKTELLAASVYPSESLQKLINRFNRNNKDVVIKYKDYSAAENPSLAFEEDIGKGNIPDILVINGGIGDMNPEQCIKKGILADLSEYLENDAEVNTGILLPNIKEAIKFNGGYYYLPEGFNVWSIVGNSEKTGSISGWNVSEFCEYYNSHPESVMFVRDTRRGNLESWMQWMVIENFVDFEKGSCSFDSEDFRSFLELCNKGIGNEEVYNGVTLWKSFTAGNEPVAYSMPVTPDYLQVMKSLLDGKNVTVGYPDNDRKGNYVNLGTCLAISASAKEKDKAWEFIKTVLSESNQAVVANDQYRSYIPCSISGFEEYLKNCKKNYAGSHYGIEGYDVELHNMTEEEEAEFRSFIDSAVKTNKYQMKIGEMVLEDAELYFNGEKSLDEVIRMIQDRVAIYLAENS